jgi:hypothetical protein
VRDERWKYLRNYYPQQPYVSWIPFRNAHPIMQELFRLHALGELDGIPAQFLADSRPSEELYDCESDPHETVNLASDPAHRDTLERMRGECDRWLAEVGDMGEIDEAQMVATWYPDGVPEVPPPLFIAVTPPDAGTSAIEVNAEAETGAVVDLGGPALVQLHSGIQGASIEYRTDADPHWRLYSGPIRLSVGADVAIHAHADRIGFEPSSDATVRFRVA